MPDARKRVVFRQKDQNGPRLCGAVGRREAGAVSGDVHLHVKALLPQLVGEALAGEELVVVDLRVGVYVQRNLPVDRQRSVGIVDDGVTQAHLNHPFYS